MKALLSRAIRVVKTSELVSVFWDLALALRVRVFIDRVSTDANPADWPSRDKLEIGMNAGWCTVDAQWPAVLLE